MLRSNEQGMDPICAPDSEASSTSKDDDPDMTLIVLVVVVVIALLGNAMFAYLYITKDTRGSVSQVVPL